MIHQHVKVRQDMKFVAYVYIGNRLSSNFSLLNEHWDSPDSIATISNWTHGISCFNGTLTLIARWLNESKAYLVLLQTQSIIVDIPYIMFKINHFHGNELYFIIKTV